MVNFAGSSKLCKKMQKRLVVLIYTVKGLKCEYVQETAKSAIPHPLHFIFASASLQILLDLLVLFFDH